MGQQLRHGSKLRSVNVQMPQSTRCKLELGHWERRPTRALTLPASIERYRNSAQPTHPLAPQLGRSKLRGLPSGLSSAADVFKWLDSQQSGVPCRVLMARRWDRPGSLAPTQNTQKDLEARDQPLVARPFKNPFARNMDHPDPELFRKHQRVHNWRSMARIQSD